MTTEYDNIDIIGRTHETSRDKTEQIMNSYYHKSEVSTVSKLLKEFNFTNRDNIVDVGSSVGVWFNDYKNLGFKKVIGIDISEERAKKAKELGYDEIHVCNAYDMPFEDESQDCLISNDVLVHVLQDSDKLKIFKEIYRVLTKKGLFIFNIANAHGFGYTDDATTEFCRFNTLDTINKLLESSGLKIKKILSSYFVMPRIGANPKFVKYSTKMIFPITDFIMSKTNNFSNAKVVYFCVEKMSRT